MPLCSPSHDIPPRFPLWAINRFHLVCLVFRGTFSFFAQSVIPLSLSLARSLSLFRSPTHPLIFFCGDYAHPHAAGEEDMENETRKTRNCGGVVTSPLLFSSWCGCRTKGRGARNGAGCSIPAPLPPPLPLVLSLSLSLLLLLLLSSASSSPHPLDRIVACVVVPCWCLPPPPPT